MDWAVFHVEPQFVDTWVRYTRALKQRNAALQTAAPRRRPSGTRSSPVWASSSPSRGAGSSSSCSPTGGRPSAALSGLDRGAALPPGLEPGALAAGGSGWPREPATRPRHLTHSGPHRADVAVRLDGRPAREVLSRGQQKLVAAAMTLAQLRLLQVTTGTTPDAAARRPCGRARRRASASASSIRSRSSSRSSS